MAKVTDVRPLQVGKGVVLIVAAALLISLQDVVFKLFSGQLTLWQIFFIRALITLPMFWAIAIHQGLGTAIFVEAIRVWCLLRAFFLTMTFVAFYAAIPFLSLSTVGAANYTAPIFVTLLSALFIGEAVGVRNWIAVGVGFVGVLLLLQPGTDAFSAWALLPVLGAVFYALAHIITRSRCQSVALLTMALSVNMMMMLAGLVMSLLFLVWQPGGGLAQQYTYLFGSWSTPDANEWLILLLLAVIAIAVAILLAGAYQAAPPPIIATFEYSYLAFAVIWDWVFFAVQPVAASLIGMMMIVGAGLLVLLRRRGDNETLDP